MNTDKGRKEAIYEAFEKDGYKACTACNGTGTVGRIDEEIEATTEQVDKIYCLVDQVREIQDTIQNEMHLKVKLDSYDMYRINMCVDLQNKAISLMLSLIEELYEDKYKMMGKI